MKTKMERLKNFDAKTRQTKILNRLVELSQDEKKQIDDQVLARAMHGFEGRKQRRNYWGWFAVGFFSTLIVMSINGVTKDIARRVNTPQPVIHIVLPTATPSATLIPTRTPLKTSTSQGTGRWIGKVSHYSRAGCLGCSATLTMANGQTLDDNAMTIAFNWLPMNTQVRVTNLDNGKSVIATVTDTGGFNSLNRIADLVPAIANELGTKTDVTNVLIEQL